MLEHQLGEELPSSPFRETYSSSISSQAVNQEQSLCRSPIGYRQFHRNSSRRQNEQLLEVLDPHSILMRRTGSDRGQILISGQSMTVHVVDVLVVELEGILHIASGDSAPTVSLVVARAPQYSFP